MKSLRNAVDSLTRGQIEEDLSIEEFYDCVESPRRRRTVRFLAAFFLDKERTFLEVGTIADGLAGVYGDDRHRHYVSLTQVHLPRLDEMGLAIYYDDVKKVEPTEKAVAAASLITTIEDRTGGDGDE